MGFNAFTLKAKESVKTAPQIKALLMQYFRFEKNYLCVTSEAWNNSGRDDFIAINNKGEIVCVEIKTSKSDFTAEFRNKKKHTNLDSYNRFYFCVPSELEAWAKEKLAELAIVKQISTDELARYRNAKKYGLIVVDTKIHIVKRAELLTNETLDLNFGSGDFFYDILKSMSCELTKAYEKLYLKI